jgi:iron(III) transport system permease protein
VADRGSGGGRPFWVALGYGVAGVALLLLVGIPLGELFRTGLSGGLLAAIRTLTGDGTGRAIANTVWTALAAAVLAVAGGTAAALVTERSRAPGRGALRGALLACLLSAPLVSALGWAQSYGPAGLSDRLLGLRWSGLFGPAGIVVVIAAGAVPLVYLVVAAGLAARAEPDVERAARVSGATASAAVRTVTLPLIRSAVAASAVLVFVAAANAFEVPAVLGMPAGFPTMTTRLYEDFALAADPGSFTAAVVLAVVLVLLSLLVIGVADVLLPVTRAWRTGGAAGGPVDPGRRSWGLAAAVWGFILVTAAIPLAALVLVALTRGVGLDPVPANWTLGNFTAALDTHAAGALEHSLLLAAGAATGILVLGGLTAALERSMGGRALGTAVVGTFAVAGSALAVAVLLAYGRFLRDSLLIILVAYLAKFWALGHRPLSGAADRMPADLLRAARVSGADALTMIRTVVGPLLRPALAAAWLLVFLFAVHELTMSSLLYGPGNETLAVVILNRQQLGDQAVSSALSVLLNVVIAAAAVLLLVVRRQAVRFGGRR